MGDSMRCEHLRNVPAAGRGRPADSHAARHHWLRRALVLFGLLLLSAAVPAAGRDFLVDADWLAQRQEDPNLVILEIRYHPHRHFTVGHIPGAIQVQRYRDLGDNQGSPLMRFPGRDAFQATLRRWGVNDDSTVVLYDDTGSPMASRLYYLLDLYGFDMSRVKILDGGMVEWSAFEEVTRESSPPRAPGNVTLKEANPSLYAEWSEIYARVVSEQDPTAVVLDARPHDHYTGETIRHALQGGHIPGAINAVSLAGVEPQSQKWRSEEELRQLYANVPADRTIYVYCHDSFRSTLAYVQLKSLGYPDVRVYNGGWAHWANSLTLPVVQGDQPYDEEFAL